MVIGIEAEHQWAQRLPIQDNILICIYCNQVRPISASHSTVMLCADLLAWQSYGAWSDGRFVFRHSGVAQ